MLKKNQTRSPITLTEISNIEKRNFNTGAYDRLMTEAPVRMFGYQFLYLDQSWRNYKQFPVFVKHY